MPYVSHEKLVEDNKPDYYIALRRSQKNIGAKKHDITPWLDFFLTGVIETANNGIIISKKFVLFVIEIWKKYKHLLKENLIAV